MNGEDCPLAIETSGHGAFEENHFSDDGAYIAAKIIGRLALLRKKGQRIEDMIAELQNRRKKRNGASRYLIRISRLTARKCSRVSGTMSRRMRALP